MPVIFGVACGVMFGSLFLGAVGTLLPALNRDRPGFLSRIPAQTPIYSLVMLSLSISVLYWGIIGAALGGFYILAEEFFPRTGLGSPNLAFTAGIVGLSTAVGAVLLRRLRWGRRQVIFLVFHFAILFGWLLPLLAI